MTREPSGQRYRFVFMDRIRNSWTLAKSSWGVLQKDKELALLPLMSFFIGVAAAAIFFVPALLTADDDGGLGGLGYLLMAMGALVFTFISVFFQGALVHGANERLTGGDPTVSSAISGAMGRVHRLAPWAFVVVTINLIIRALRDRLPLGNFIGALAEGAWEVLTFLVMPIMIIEDIGPIDAVKKSSAYFKRTWGENLAARVGFGLLGIAAMLPAIVLIGIGFSVGGIVTVLFVAIAVVWIAVVAASMAALNAIFQTALYWFAVQGTVAEGFGGELESAFGQR